MHSAYRNLACGLAACGLAALSGCAPSRERAPEGGAWIIPPEGPAQIYVPTRPTEDELAAAGELARILSAASGRPAYVNKEPFIFHRPGLYVGGTQAARELLKGSDALPKVSPGGVNDYAALPPEKWDNVAWAAKDGRIAISASTPLATRFAVARFAEEKCGARWWFPGPEGEDIPKADRLGIAPGTTLEKPSYYSRYFSTRKRPAEVQWLLNNGMAEHLHAHHSLHALLGKDVARAHPEWFPKFDGQPYNPDKRKGPGPHPDYRSDAAASYVAGKADQYFKTHPATPCFSISPADNSLFGDLDAYKGLVDPNASFRGKANLSNAVFHFDNRVAKAVAARYPDRYLGALAYAFYEEVPDFPVEPNIVPFLTADRSQWYDGDFRAEDLALVAKWAKKGPKIIATWDYYYGQPYFVPRVMLSVVKDSIPALHEAGLDAFYAEVQPVWGFDAPKAWIAAHLLWNSRANPDRLEAEFFDGCYGLASEVMLEFFRKCDALWMTQPGKARWIRYYGDLDQAVIFPPEAVRELRGMLDKALCLPLPEKYRRRVELTSNAFLLTERLSSVATATRRVAEWTPGDDPAGLEAALPDYFATRKDAEHIFDKALPLNDAGPVLGYLTDDDPLAGRLVLSAGLFDAPAKARLAALLPDSYRLLMEGGARFLLDDPFASGLKYWLVTEWPNPELEAKLDGGTLSVAHANTYCLTLKARATPGRVQGIAFGADGRVSASSSIQLTLEYLDSRGKTLSIDADSLPYGDLVNAPLAVAARAPEGAAIVRATLAVKYQAPDDILRLHAWRQPAR